jgi:hypothetical protein
MLEISEIDKPFRKLSHGLLANEVKLLERSINRPFAIFSDRTKMWAHVFSKQLPWLVRTEETLRIFKQRVDETDEVKGLYLSIRQADGRTPSGYITDMLAIIPDGNRKIEDKIYSAFGELLRTSGSLLFDLHIVKLRGRRIEEVVPVGFWRYGWTSNHIS